ncbi:hypothetical protein EMIT051CA3_10329 [Pseudomonas chlororaphis]
MRGEKRRFTLRKSLRPQGRQTVPGSVPRHGSTAVLLVDRVGQAFSHNQLDNFLGSDFDGSASRWVTASTGRTLGHFQFADTWQSDFAAIFQLISNDLGQLVQSVTRGGFRRVDSFSDISDQLVFSNSHCGVPSLSNSFGLQSAVSAIEPDLVDLAPRSQPRKIGVIDTEIRVWFDLTNAECTLNAETSRKTGQN